MPCPIYRRIAPDVFFQELVELSFKDEHAKEIVGWLQVVSERQSGQSFLSGKKSAVIKGCLAYIGSRVLDEPNYYLLTQQKIALHFHLGSHYSIAQSFRAYLKFLGPEFTINRDLKKDQFRF